MKILIYFLQYTVAVNYSQSYICQKVLRRVCGVLYLQSVAALEFYKIHMYSMATTVVDDYMTLKHLFMGDILIWEQGCLYGEKN